MNTWPFPTWPGPIPVKTKKEKRNDYPQDLPDAPF
jgi:hypothetical protein